MKYIFSNILLFLSALFLTACGDSNDEPGKGGGDFLVGKTELAYSREGGSQEINVRSSVEPRVSVDAPWVTFSVARRGSADIYALTVNVAANDADFDDRNAVMTVTDGSSTATVNIKQTYA
ncbi:MAG: BACON domain-containing protein, partial [Duncaniella sp.]|nr:BACON domain-containing protein [Duncaniella sp.]